MRTVSIVFTSLMFVVSLTCQIAPVILLTGMKLTSKIVFGS